MSAPAGRHTPGPITVGSKLSDCRDSLQCATVRAELYRLRADNERLRVALGAVTNMHAMPDRHYRDTAGAMRKARAALGERTS